MSKRFKTAEDLAHESGQEFMTSVVNGSARCDTYGPSFSDRDVTAQGTSTCTGWEIVSTFSQEDTGAEPDIEAHRSVEQVSPMPSGPFKSHPQRDRMHNWARRGHSQIGYSCAKKSMPSIRNHRVVRSGSNYSAAESKSYRVQPDESAALHRRWVALPLPPTASTYSDGITVMTYNVLCDALLWQHRHLYRRCDPSILPWARRRHLLILRIEQVNPDLLFLQEVQAEHFSFFQDQLTAKGYHGAFTQRPRKPDGCAAFYKTEVFEFEYIWGVPLSVQGSSIMDRPNVGQVLLLRHRSTDVKICGINTHLLFNPNRGDVKLMQIALLLGKAAELVGGVEHLRNLPLVVAGDLNACPGSVVLEFLSGTVIPYCRQDRRLMSGQQQSSGGASVHPASPKCGLPPAAAAQFRDVVPVPGSHPGCSCSGHCQEAQHPFKLASAQPMLPNEISSMVGTDQGILVDHIFVSSHLIVQHILELRSADALIRLGGMPNHKEPSDHQPVAIRIILKNLSVAL